MKIRNYVSIVFGIIVGILTSAGVSFYFDLTHVVSLLVGFLTALQIAWMSMGPQKWLKIHKKSAVIAFTWFFGKRPEIITKNSEFTFQKLGFWNLFSQL